MFDPVIFMNLGMILLCSASLLWSEFW